MQYRNFGKTGFEASVFGFGGAAISGESGGYGFGAISEDDAIKLLHAAFDLGINLYDTAPIYGFGESERRIGKAFLKNREKVFIVSKSGVSWHSNKRVNMTNDPTVTHDMLHQSLKDLKSDYIDLYMIHWPDPKVDVRRAFEVLVKAKDQGKIRFLGLSNTNLEDFEKASQLSTIDAVQAEYNFFERHAELQGLSLAKLNGCAFMGWGTLDKGILTGRVDKSRVFDQSDCRSHAPWWKSQNKDPKYAAMDKIKKFCEANDLSLLEFALGFVLSNELVSTALCGPKSIAQLNEINLALAKSLTCSEIIDKTKNIYQSFADSRSQNQSGTN